MKPIFPDESLATLVRQRTIVGAEIQLLGVGPRGQQYEPLKSVRINSMSDTRIDYVSRPIGEAAKIEHHGVRVRAGVELRKFLESGGEAPQYSLINVSKRAGRSPRILFAGAEISLPLSFEDSRLLPKVIEHKGRNLLGFFAEEATDYTARAAIVLVGLNPETKRLGRVSL